MPHDGECRPRFSRPVVACLGSDPNAKAHALDRDFGCRASRPLRPQARTDVIPTVFAVPSSLARRRGRKISGLPRPKAAYDHASNDPGEDHLKHRHRIESALLAAAVSPDAVSAAESKQIGMIDVPGATLADFDISLVDPATERCSVTASEVDGHVPVPVGTVGGGDGTIHVFAPTSQA